MQHRRLRKRSTSTEDDGRKKGSCVKLRPCGTEAACRQYDRSTYICVCPHDYSRPDENLKCPKRQTVPVYPKPFTNLSINKNEPKPVQQQSAATVLNYNNINNNNSIYNNKSDQLLGGTMFNHTATTFSSDNQQDICVMGYVIGANMLMIGVAVIAAVVSVLCVLFVCRSRRSDTCCKHKRSKNKNVIHEDCYALNPIYTSPGLPKEKVKETILIQHLNSNSITDMKEIGQGFFGKVYKGTVKQTDGKVETVAIKVLKENVNAEALEDFMGEIEIMTYFRHPNILKLIGIVPQSDKTPWMVFEYMAYGDLTEVLRNSSGQFANSSSHLPVLDWDSLMTISMEIAAGMKYLANQRFVHRDLACRNCLVDHNRTVKIADFGMSRDIYTCDYYKVGGNRMLPVRWMSPECIVYGKFTLESDVWSYGVVLWEIYSYGKQPYYGYSNDQALKLVQDGVLLEIPLNCPPLICVLMNGCWKSDPKERPRFIDIYDRLRNATKRAELDSPLPRPPALPAIVDHLSLRKARPDDRLPLADDQLPMPDEQLPPLDDDCYLCPDRLIEYEYVGPPRP